jgi:hypothetical protein
MSQTLPSQQEAAPPIRAIIIQPDNTYEAREVSQEIRVFQDLVGGYLETWSTEHCVIWWDEHAKIKEQPFNNLATHLWWNLAEEMEGRDVLQGTVFVTGPTTDELDNEPVSDDVIDYFQRIEKAVREQGASDASCATRETWHNWHNA